MCGIGYGTIKRNIQMKYADIATAATLRSRIERVETYLALPKSAWENMCLRRGEERTGEYLGHLLRDPVGVMKGIMEDEIIRLKRELRELGVEV